MATAGAPTQLVRRVDRRARRGRWADPRRLPIYTVAVAVLFSLIALWPEHRSVWYLNDAAVHQSMVRWAAGRMQAGHLPFDGWYPYLSMGASRFHHYQSLPHIVTATLSLALGDGTFRWSLYLLLAFWPISVFAGGRLLSLGVWPAAAAALISPLLTSAPGLGYEWSSYVWAGSGTWAQLWGMWALPLAWGLSWRAVAKGKQLWLAVLAVGLSVSLHLLTGYLVLLSLAVFVLVTPSDFRRRIGRAAVVGVGGLAAAAWTLVPLIWGAPWAINDEFSRGTFFYDSFGARRIMGWLVTGRLFDDGRLPVVTALVVVGLVLAIATFRRSEPGRVVLGLGSLSLLLFFGRPTLGRVLDLLPGGGDLFLRRYIMGVHLAGLYLAGLGLAWLAVQAAKLLRSKAPTLPAAWRAAAITAAALILLAPSICSQIRYIARDWRWIPQQERAQAVDGAQYGALVDRATSLGPGRIFSEKRSGRASRYNVGSVPTYAVLLNLQADSVGFTRPTWSLASGAEYRFDVSAPSLPDLFGVRYIIFPKGWTPPQGAVTIAGSGRHVLYELPDIGYMSVVDTIAPIIVDRNDIGRQTSSFLSSGLPAKAFIPTLAFGGRPAADPTLNADEEPRSRPGSVVRADAQPADGLFEADVQIRRPAVVLLKASFDPRFRAQVDGRDVPIQMVAPAFVGVPVTPGTHHVSVVYAAYPWYGPLFALSFATVFVLWLWGRRATKRA